MMIDNPVALAELKQRLREIEGTVTLLRHRKFYLVRIDQVELLPTRLRIHGFYLRRIEEYGLIDQPLLSGTFCLGCPWEFLADGHGVVYARYCAWCVYYDREFATEISRFLESKPDADLPCVRMIQEWESNRHKTSTPRLPP